MKRALLIAIVALAPAAALAQSTTATAGATGLAVDGAARLPGNQVGGLAPTAPSVTSVPAAGTPIPVPTVGSTHLAPTEPAFKPRNPYQGSGTLGPGPVGSMPAVESGSPY